MNFTVEKELTDEELEDIFTTAIEGGIGYWACLRNDEESWEASERSVIAAGKHPYWSTVMLHVLQSGESVRFQDADDTENGDIWEYNMDSLRQSCIKYEQQRGSIKKCLEDGNFDAVEADIFMQLGLFGEVIYG